jgi:hypothetical protein
MTATRIFEMGAAPLSFATRHVVHWAKSSIPNGVVWHIIDALQIYTNWLLISLLVSWILWAVSLRKNTIA